MSIGMQGISEMKTGLAGISSVEKDQQPMVVKSK
jgi:hypothetical protein